MKELFEYLRLFKERYCFYFNEALPSENEIERLVNDIAIKAVNSTLWFILLSPIALVVLICVVVVSFILTLQ